MRIRVKCLRAASLVSLAGLAAALAGFAATGRGSQPAGASGASFCGHVMRVDRLVVRRVNHLPENHNRFTFPATVTISGPRQAQAVAHAACLLPPMPGGSMTCGGDFGVEDLLRFTAKASSKTSTIKAEAGGCEEVHGSVLLVGPRVHPPSGGCLPRLWVSGLQENRRSPE